MAAFSLAEPLDIRYVEDVEELVRESAGDLIRVPDLRHGGEERDFKIVSVDNPTHSGIVREPSTMIDNLNVYVTDAE